MEHILWKEKVSKNSLKVNVSWTFLGNAIFAICQWLFIIIFAKFGNQMMVGQYSLALAITAPIFLLTNLQLRDVLATDAKNTYNYKSYFALRVVSIILSLTIIFIISHIGSYDGDTRKVILLVAISKAIESLSDISYGVFQKNEMMKNIAISLILRGVSSIVFLLLLLVGTNSVVFSLVGVIVSWGLVLVFFDFKNVINYIDFNAVIKFRFLKNIFKLSLPLGIVVMLVSLNTNIPRYFIQSYLGTTSVGLFSSISYIVIAGNTVITALGQSISPRLSKYYSEGNVSGYKHLLSKMLIISVILGLLGIFVVLLFGEFILSLIYTKEYKGLNNIFLLVMISACFSYLSSIFGFSMTAARKFNVQPILFITVLCVCLLSSMLLIPNFGLYGAALTMVIFSFVQFVGSLIVNLLILKEQVKGDGLIG